MKVSDNNFINNGRLDDQMRQNSTKSMDEFY